MSYLPGSTESSTLFTSLTGVVKPCLVFSLAGFEVPFSCLGLPRPRPPRPLEPRGRPRPRSVPRGELVRLPHGDEFGGVDEPEDTLSPEKS